MFSTSVIRASPLWCAAAVLATAAAPTSIRAFERETVEGRPDTPLFWSERDIAVRPAADTSADLPPDAVGAAVEAAAAEWQLAASDCSDLTLSVGSPPRGTDTNLGGGERDGENRIVWREDEWPEEVSPDALAITTMVYRTATGEVLDADIDVNGVHFYWTASDEAGSVVNDVQNTVTHELGHLLGFAHSSEAEATMFGRSDPGETSKRRLHADDIAALCTVYPFGAASPGALETHSSGLTSGAGCAVSGGGSGAPSAWPLAVLLLLVRGARRRRRAPPARA